MKTWQRKYPCDSSLFKSIIDWDYVGAVPPKISAISIADTFFESGSRYKVDNELDHSFRTELRNIELEKCGSAEWSQMFIHSKENRFLFDILHRGDRLSSLRRNHPKLLSEALLRNHDTIAIAAAEWKAFVEETYLRKGLAIPDYAHFIQIREALDLYGSSKLQRIFRIAQKNLSVFIHPLKTWVKKRLRGSRRKENQ